MSDHTTDAPTHDAEGRLFVLTGPGADDVARALTAALPRAASVDGAVVEAMFASESGIAPSDTRSDLERRYLRYTAGIALADSFRFAGYDAVVAEEVPPEHLEPYLDFAAPAAVHLVHLTGGGSPHDGSNDGPDDSASPTSDGRGDAAGTHVDRARTDVPGLVLDGADPVALAGKIVARADEARVEPPADVED